MGMTPMIAPDGSSGDIPNARVAEAVRAGGKVGAWMLDPQGNRGVIPLDRTTDAIQAGARPIAPMNVPTALSGQESQFYQQHPANVLYRDIRSTQSPEAVAGRQKVSREVQHEIGVNAGMMAGGVATGGLLEAPEGASLAARAAYLLGRAGLSGAGQGIGALVGGASPDEAKTAAEVGAVAQPVAEGVGAIAKSVAPKIAESALNITDRMRGRGRTIGDAVLEETTGIKPGTLATETKQAIGSLVQKMEQGVDTATQQGKIGTTATAHAVLDDALDNLPRNAASIRAKLSGLGDLLHFGNTGSTVYSPNELLEMKRGIGMEIKSWPSEWQNLDAVKQVQQKLYGALDSELDRIVPGNADINQTISSLIPAKQQAVRMSQGASIAQLMAHRLAAHTGALAASGIGGAVGYREGGAPGAAIGAAAGLALPELLSSPTGQMTLARMLNALGPKATSPEILPLVKALAAHAASSSQVPAAQPNAPGEPFHPNQGVQ